MHKGPLIKWGLLLLFGALAFFGFPLPAIFSGAVDWVTDIDLWIINNAAYPGLFAIALGLILGLGILPDLWRILENIVSREPQPNWPIYEALNHITHRSEWAYHNRDLGSKTAAAALDFRHRALSGEIQIWGEPKSRVTRGKPELFNPKESPIRKDYWQTFEIHWQPIFEPRSKDKGKAQTRPIDSGRGTLGSVRYTNLRVNRRQILTEEGWRRATPWTRIKSWIAKSGTPPTDRRSSRPS